MKELLQKNSIRKLLSVALALLLWQAGAVLLDLPLLLVPPLEVLKRLLTLVQEADFWRTLLFSFSRIVLGFAIVGLEAGNVFLYRAGWKISAGSLSANLCLAVVLLFVGYFLFHEQISARQLIGVAVCAVGLFLITK